MVFSEDNPKSRLILDLEPKIKSMWKIPGKRLH
jgi:hypothetical protein